MPHAAVAARRGAARREFFSDLPNTGFNATITEALNLKTEFNFE